MMTQEEEHEEEEKEEAKKTGDVGRGQTKENGNVKGVEWTGRGRRGGRR